MKKYIHFTIPSQLNEKILSLKLNNSQLKQAYKFIHAFRNISLRNEFDLYTFVPFPTKLIVKILNSRYRVLINKLKTNDVIQIHSWCKNYKIVESYDIGRCKKYRINPSLINDKMAHISYDNSSDYETDNFFRINKRKISKDIVINDLKTLTINKTALMECMEETLVGINYSDFLIDTEIKENSFCVINHFTGFEYWITREKCMQYTKEHGCTLIKDGNKYYLDDFDRYIEMKKRNIKWSYSLTINRLFKGSYYIGRNKRNKRLDHNLTSTPKKLMEIILSSNNLIEIDLKNSQFAILAYLMSSDPTVNKTEDFATFCEVTATGKLYEYIAKEFSLSTRNEAKTIMMELAFSSHKYKSAQKVKLKTLFPTVVAYIESYKKEAARKYDSKAHNRFAILLQKTESKIFIDHLYFELKIRQGFFILTKHDSLIIKKQDETHIRRFMEDYFAEIGLNCTIN